MVYLLAAIIIISAATSVRLLDYISRSAMLSPLRLSAQTEMIKLLCVCNKIIASSDDRLDRDGQARGDGQVDGRTDGRTAGKSL